MPVVGQMILLTIIQWEMTVEQHLLEMPEVKQVKPILKS